MKLCMFLSLLLGQCVLSAQSALFDQRITEGSNVTIQCENEGRVTWSKRVDGKREIILKAPSEEDPVQSKPGPEPRYSLLTNLSLVIQEALVSDSGIYFCNITPVVNLTVTALNGGVSGVEQVLFVSLAALFLFLTTIV